MCGHPQTSTLQANVTKEPLQHTEQARLSKTIIQKRSRDAPSYSRSLFGVVIELWVSKGGTTRGGRLGGGNSAR